MYASPSLLEQLMRLIFPVKCMICEKNLLENSLQYICPACKDNLPRYGRGFVKNAEVVLVDKIFSGFNYNDGIEKAIQKMKYNNDPRLARTIAELLCEELFKESSMPHFDYIIPVPMHSSKKRQRGYNQTELLAKELARLLVIEHSTDILIKTRQTKAQSSLKREERLNNLKGAFSEGKGISKVKDVSVLLVDDVATTGTTLNTCAKILLDYGVSKIYAMVIAIA